MCVCFKQRSPTGGTGSPRKFCPVAVSPEDSSEIIHPTDKQYSGAVSALDAFGRTHLAAEKMIDHEMRIDLSGKVLPITS